MTSFGSNFNFENKTLGFWNDLEVVNNMALLQTTTSLRLLLKNSLEQTVIFTEMNWFNFTNNGKMQGKVNT